MTSRAPLFGILAAVLLAVAFWFLLYQPKSDEQTRLESETAQFETEQQSLENEIARLREVEANQVEIAAQLARLEEYVPSTTAQPAFIRQLQVAADASGVEILTVTFGDPVPVQDAPPTGEPDTVLASVEVTVTVRGGYFQAVDLFRRLETEVTRAVLLSSVTMGPGQDGFPQLATTWGGAIFAVVPVTQVPPPPAPDATAPAQDGTPPAGGGTATPAPGATPTPTTEVGQ